MSSTKNFSAASEMSIRVRHKDPTRDVKGESSRTAIQKFAVGSALPQQPREITHTDPRTPPKHVARGPRRSEQRR
jgi:hypothetical protein